VGKEDAAELLSIDGREVKVTNPDKPYFSRDVKLSKLDLVRYYLAVAPGALAGIRDRPVVLKRFVNGAEAEAFYQKRAPERTPTMAPHGDALFSIRPHRRRGCRRRCRWTRLDRQSRLH
jgi:DNA primase